MGSTPQCEEQKNNETRCFPSLVFHIMPKTVFEVDHLSFTFMHIQFGFGSLVDDWGKGCRDSLPICVCIWAYSIYAFNSNSFTLTLSLCLYLYLFIHTRFSSSFFFFGLVIPFFVLLFFHTSLTIYKNKHRDSIFGLCVCMCVLSIEKENNKEMCVFVCM